MAFKEMTLYERITKNKMSSFWNGFFWGMPLNPLALWMVYQLATGHVHIYLERLICVW